MTAQFIHLDIWNNSLWPKNKQKKDAASGPFPPQNSRDMRLPCSPCLISYIEMSGCFLFWSMIVWQVKGSLKPQLAGLASCPVSFSACNSLLPIFLPWPSSDIAINGCWGKPSLGRGGASITSPLAVTSILELELNSRSLSNESYNTHDAEQNCRNITNGGLRATQVVSLTFCRLWSSGGV